MAGLKRQTGRDVVAQGRCREGLKFCCPRLFAAEMACCLSDEAGGDVVTLVAVIVAIPGIALMEQE